MAGLRERHREQRLDQVLDAASALFAANGYSGTRIEAIADRATVAPATIYKYFETKQNIVAALALRHVRAVLPERRRLLRSPPADPRAAIIAFENLLAERALQHLTCDCWRVLLAAGLIDPDSSAHRTAKRLRSLIIRQYVALIGHFQRQGQVRRDLDARALAEVLHSVGERRFMEILSNDGFGISDAKRAVARDLEFVFRGVLA